MNIGGYLIEELIGESATSQVYKVRHPKLQSIHACKVVPNLIAEIPSLRSAYLSQAHWQIENQTPFGIRVTDVIETSDHLGIIMDWLEGGTLKNHLDRFGKVDVHPALRWGVQVLSALHVLHEDALVHLDISSHNIFIQKTEEGSVAILMDSGIHRHLEGAAQRFPLSISSLRYRAPEEIHQNQKTGPWTDIYSIGAILYEMMTGRPLYSGTSEYSVMHAINGGKYPSIKSSVANLPEGLDEIIHRSLSKEPTKRFQSAKEMLSAIHKTVQLPEITKAINIPTTVPKSETESNVLIEENGEWVLQGGIIDEPEEFTTELVERRLVRPSKPVVGFAGVVKAWIWRVRNWIRGVFLLSAILIILLLGGAITGRETSIRISDIPTWGSFKAELDEEYISGIDTQQSLTLGEHKINMFGGVFEIGGCGRCCWSDSYKFNIPFGWGEYSEEVDMGKRTDMLRCPTVEQAYLFETVDVLQDVLGASFDITMRADNSIQHQVTLSNTWRMGKTEVTQAMYQQVMNTFESGDGTLPKRNVSWLEAIEFCNRLSEIEGLEPCYQVSGGVVLWESGTSCQGYRLPTEAEWEVSAKSGNPLMLDGRPNWFSGGGNASLLAWYSTNSQQRVHPVGGKYPNAFGLYDMSGNVSEWVWDGYSPYLGDAFNPKGIKSNTKTVRGGHFLSPLTQIRVFDRTYANKNYRSETIGFRIVRTR